MTCVQRYLPFNLGSSRTILAENSQQNSSVFFPNQHEKVSPNSQSPDVTLFTQQNSPEYNFSKIKNQNCKSHSNRENFFAASLSTDKFGPEVNQPQGQWTEKSNRIQTQTTQKLTHQITRQTQLAMHNKKTHLLTIYDPQKLPGDKTDTYKLQDPNQSTETLNNSEMPVINTYDKTPQKIESENSDRFNPCSNVAKSFDLKSEYLSQIKFHQQSPNGRISRFRDVEIKEKSKSKSNDNNAKFVDPKVSPTSAKILDKLNRNEKNEPVSRSREELSKRTRRPQPKVEAAYSRRW